MDFDEPDLEELIQNDLRSEMNKILSQSEVDEIEAAASHGVVDHDARHSPHEIFPSSRIMHHGYRRDFPIKAEPCERNLEESQAVHGEFDVMESSLLQELQSQHSPLPRGHHEISGHFSVGSYADFTGELGHYPAEVTEHSDLSSLTWLTTVDVQALQKLTEQGRVIASSSMPGIQQHSSVQQGFSQAQGIPEHRSVIQMVPAASNIRMPTETSNIQHQIPQTTITSAPIPSPEAAAQMPETSSSRYAAIQPHISQEGRRFLAQQRYHLNAHPSGGPIGRHSFESGHIGPRRYVPGAVVGHHPYPPPPYANGTPRPGFLHSGLMHSRFHPHHGQPQKVYPKPVYSYSCLIAMALYNSKTGCLPVSDIYNFMMENYPYFKTAPDGWKNSVRHNLSLNKCFEKVEKPNGTQRKGCLWALNPAKVAKMKEEVQKWKRKDPDSIRRSMSNPEELDRELEEMRRVDEEQARRRMLSLTSHGLTTSSMHNMHHLPPHHPHHPQNILHMHHHPSVPSHINSSAAGPSSVPTTSQRHPGQHFSTELAQENFARTLARSASQPSPAMRNPFDLSPLGHSSQHASGAAPVSINLGSNNNNNSFSGNSAMSPEMIILTSSGGRSTLFTSPQSSSSSTTSSNTSLLGTFTEVSAVLGVDDFDASLADLAGLHDSFWDGTLNPQTTVASDVSEAFSESDSKVALPIERNEESSPMTSEGCVPLPPVIRVLSSHSREQASPDTPDFKSSTSQRVDNFGRDLTCYASNNIKPVVLL
ncbi:uncharacterized protein LOC120343123 isoform X2 [Styela clava]